MFKIIIKEIIIILLLLLAIILALGVFLYDYIPTNRTIPTVEKYETSQTVKEELDEQITKDETVLVTYEITSADLKKLEKSKDYKKGKSNPFSAYETVDGNSDTNVGTNNESNVTNTDTINTNSGTSTTKSSTFYKDTGTK